MIISSILLFSVAASLGLYLVVLGVCYQRSSPKIGLSHASIGLLALVLLFMHIINGAMNKYNNVAALLMILAVIGGLMLFALREQNKPPPMALVGLLVLFLGLDY